MTCLIRMQSALNPIAVAGDLLDNANTMNIAMSNGKFLAILESSDGGPIAISVPNILSIEEVDDDAVTA